MLKATDDMGSSSSPDIRRTTMKTIVSAFVALTFIAGAVAPAAAAAYSGSLIERLDQDRRGGHGNG